MCVCMYVHMSIERGEGSMYMYICIFVYMYICIYVYIESIRWYVYVCIYICLYVYM